MKVGISITHYAPVGGDPAERLRLVVQQVQRAEQLGYDSISLGHHYLTRSAFLQTMPLATYLAAVTTRIRIALGVFLLPLHSPVAVAEDLATMDVVSNGRLIAGFGSGYRSVEYNAFGVPFDERGRRLTESVGLIRRLWSGETVTGSGHFGELREVQLHLRPASVDRIPIWLGGFSAPGIRRAAQLGVSWLGPPGGDVGALAESLDLFDAERAKAGVTDPVSYPTLREALVLNDGDRARTLARPHLEAQYRDYRGWKHGESIDHLIEESAIVGDPYEAVGRLQALAEIGIDHVIMRMEWPGTQPELVIESMEALAPMLDTLHSTEPVQR